MLIPHITAAGKGAGLYCANDKPWVQQTHDCLHLSIDLPVKLIQNPWLSASYCWNSPFPHILCQTYQFPLHCIC